ncbi:poly-A polymerase [Gilbertella persicaria]|uniref:poly-A polymerase n=1 Tax=Gilbertella persicaria TaxID=101096 RepID=UPI00221F0F25|nr:poly-A polymerase [Gilbertella persicaria]KAI8047287.1 poly-A polymerase [Gilbertella persicaria]
MVNQERILAQIFFFLSLSLSLTFHLDIMFARKYPGTTLPLSTAAPTVMDVTLTTSLEHCLQRNGMYDSPERTEQREAALKHLTELTRQFVRTVCQRKGLPKPVIEKAGGAVFTFGSYKLGVNSADADIDTLCVVPCYVERRDFFVDMLSTLKSTACISDITSVPDSFVPVIKFKYNDIPIDLVCARLNLPEVPATINVNNNNLLVGLDDKCVRSINGTRVADDIMSLVPNLSTFRIALRCIKLWAQRKAVYSNVLGFFGGVAWAILVARVCQLYPNASASVVVSKFFRILTEWNWSAAPVMLKHIEDGPSLSSSLRPWNNRINLVDKSHRMPVITPSYPSMCATHNVTASTQRIILGEFNMAAQTVDKIMMGSLPWSALFLPHTFFQNYKYYLQVIVSSDAHARFLGWSGLVEAKLRLLVTKLETVPSIALVHPYIHGFKHEHLCHSPEEVYAATHGQFKPPHVARRRRPAKIYTKIFYIGLYIRMRPDQSRTLDLTRPIYEFTRSVTNWSDYDRKHMGIIVENVRRSDLPEEVHKQAASIMSKRALSKSPSPQLQPATLPTRPSPKATKPNGDIKKNVNKKAKTLINKPSMPNTNEETRSFAMATSTV